MENIDLLKLNSSYNSMLVFFIDTHYVDNISYVVYNIYMFSL